jgi:phosphonate metabolism protein PhnN/1,5-bisphosphokinase (PRPP-forming)
MLFLVVGPRGAGKDTLLDAAREALAGDDRFVLAQRVITRIKKAGGENHVAASDEEFANLTAQGAFMLHWHAHGLSYGIQQTALHALERGQHVIANASRSILDQARTQYVPTRVLLVTVSEPVSRQRLLTRGREQAADIEQRLARASAFAVSGPEVVTILNEGSIEDGTTAFLAALRI